MTILVSGATGFVGSAITRHLLAAGQSVRAMSRSAAGARRVYEADESGRRAVAESRLGFVEADVTKPASLPAAVEGVEAVIQAAQFTGAPVEDPARGLTYQAVDRDGTVNLLEAIAEAVRGSGVAAASATVGAGSGIGGAGGAKRGASGAGGQATGAVEASAGHGAVSASAAPHFFYMSGITVTPEAKEPWNRAKWQAEEAIRGSGLDWTIVRSCWAYGPRDTALNRILGYSDYLPFVPIFGRGEGLLTPVFIEDVGRLFASLVGDRERARNTTFALGGPDTVTLNEFLRLALQTMGRRRPILHIPKGIGKIQGAIMQHLPGRPLSPDAVDFVSQAGAVGEADRRLLAERFPGFEATPLREGLGGYLGR